MDVHKRSSVDKDSVAISVEPAEDFELDDLHSGGHTSVPLLTPDNTDITPSRSIETFKTNHPANNVVTEVDSPGKLNYASKKNVAEGMMDIALLTANANQLRFLITYNLQSKTFYVSVVLMILSLVLQVSVGIALIFKDRYTEQVKYGSHGRYLNLDRGILQFCNRKNFTIIITGIIICTYLL